MAEERNCGIAFTNEFSKEIYESTYKFGDENIDETHGRVARFIAQNEKDAEYWAERFKYILKDFKFVPGGRILSNAGIPTGGTTLINCFVGGFMGYDQDSWDSISDELKRQGKILKSEGGYGFCVDVLRPRGTFISGIGSNTPGAVKMLDMWDTQSSVIAAGSGKKSEHKNAKKKIRKGAQMVTMSVYHPDIQEFITAKQEPGRLTKFNMSVLVTDDFMDAVNNNKPWSLEFPDIEKAKNEYLNTWDGNIKTWKSRNLPTIVYHTYDNANELWDLIMKSTYNRNEPGVLFIDTINKMNNLYYCEYINASNPCVAVGTLVNTVNGYEKIEDIKVGDEVWTVLGIEQADKIESHKNYPVFKVTFSDGGEQIVTAAHQYHAKRKGSISKYYKPIQLSDLNIGDIIRIEPSFVDISGSGYYDGLKAGILLGDGCVTDNTAQIKIATNIDDVIYNTNVKKIFGKELFIKDSFNYGKSMSMIFLKGSIDIECIGVKKAYSYDKCIDYKFAKGAYIMGVLDGLLATDGDINLHSNHPAIRFSTTSKNLAQDIRNLLLAIGCHGIISSTFDDSGAINGRKIIRKHTKYTISVSGKSFKHYFKQTKLNELHPDKYNKIKTAIIQCSLHGNHFNTKIESIESYGTADVYDIYCKESDTWLTSGYVQRGCGEQPIPVGGVCLLGSLNLTQFLLPDFSDFDYDELAEHIRIAVRFMDNVNDITYVPLDIQRENLRNKRRIGLGVMGYGSALIMLNKRYGSDDALVVTSKLMDFIKNTAYQSSVELAREKGPFQLFDKEKYMAGKFIETLSDETRGMIEQHGIRNSHILSIQPTGNTSTMSNVISSGLEPVFMFEYVRTSIVDYWPDGLPKIESVEWDSKKFTVSGVVESDDAWQWVKEGDESLLKCSMTDSNGSSVTYKYDKNRGLTKESAVTDYGVRFLQDTGRWNKDAEWAMCTENLDIDDHVRTMKVFAENIDASLSKTINLPNNYPYDKFKDVYKKLHATGIVKGCTTYRDGTMMAVLSSKDKKSESRGNKMFITSAPRRPKALPCDIHNLTVNGKPWIVLIGMFEDESGGTNPYEVFAFRKRNVQLPRRLKNGLLVKVKSGVYNLIITDADGASKLVIENIRELFEKNEEESLTRMISTAMRHGAHLKYVVDQLNKSEGTIVSFSKAIARTLKKYLESEDEITDKTCPNCGDPNGLRSEDGCVKCKSCEYSRCG